MGSGCPREETRGWLGTPAGGCPYSENPHDSKRLDCGELPGRCRLPGVTVQIPGRIVQVVALIVQVRARIIQVRAWAIQDLPSAPHVSPFRRVMGDARLRVRLLRQRRFGLPAFAVGSDGFPRAQIVGDVLLADRSVGVDPA